VFYNWSKEVFFTISTVSFQRPDHRNPHWQTTSLNNQANQVTSDVAVWKSTTLKLGNFKAINEVDLP
jgi:hypothetical protein